MRLCSRRGWRRPRITWAIRLVAPPSMLLRVLGTYMRHQEQAYNFESARSQERGGKALSAASETFNLTRREPISLALQGELDVA